MHIILETTLLFFRLIGILFKSLLSWIIPRAHKPIKGEVCLLTGAGSGIGRLMALEFANRGAVMVLWDINEKGNIETAQMIERVGGTAFADTCDISDREQVYKAAKKARDVVGSDITILVNNAGIVYGKEFMDIKDEEIEKTIKVNSLAHIWTVRAFLPNMLQNNHGHIVTIASIAGLVAAPGMPDYICSKHAAVGFHNALELDIRRYGKNGVKTTLVCPYHINTGMFSGSSTRFPRLLAPLEPAYCVEKIMHAVLTDRTMVAIPRTMYFNFNATTWLPHEASVALLEFLGVFEFMSKFVPMREYQKKAAEEKVSE